MQKENLQNNGHRKNDGIREDSRQQNANKMGVMPVPKLVITMSFPIMVSMLVPLAWLFGTLGGPDMVWFAFWISEIAAVVFAIVCLKKIMKKIG